MPWLAIATPSILAGNDNNNQSNGQITIETAENSDQIHTDTANGNEQINADDSETISVEVRPAAESNDKDNKNNDDKHRRPAATKTAQQIPRIEGDSWGPCTYRNTVQVELGPTPRVHNENDHPGASNKQHTYFNAFRNLTITMWILNMW